MSAIIRQESLQFLNNLSAHNNREWFNEHKELYTQAHENIIGFADALLSEMNNHDHIETPTGKKSLYRIYKDVRFSKEKTPYNTHWSGGFKRATKQLRGGYYFRIQPGNCLVGGGFWGPNTDDMKRIRQDIDYNYEHWQKLFSDKSFIQTFGQLAGEQLSSAPRGYEKNHPAIDLLKHKQFILIHRFSDTEVTEPDFAKKANDVFKKMRPFFDYMSEVLTTDANGEPVI